MLKQGDYLKPFTSEDAKEIIAFAEMADFPMHDQRRSEHRELMFSASGLCFTMNGLTGSDCKTGRPFTKQEFLTHIANSDNHERFQVCTMYKLGIEPGAIVSAHYTSPFIIPSYCLWTKERDGFQWKTKDCAPHRDCYLNSDIELMVFATDVCREGISVSRLYESQWVRLNDHGITNEIFKIVAVSSDQQKVLLDNDRWYEIKQLLAITAEKTNPIPGVPTNKVEDAEIRVGDTVERTVNNKLLDKPHFKKGFIGVVTEINGDGLHFGPFAVGDRDKYRKIITRSLMDNVIHAGDWVDGCWIKGKLHIWGSKYRVAKADSEALWVEATTGQLVKYPFSSYKLNKVKAGGPASTIQQQPHEYQVSGAKVQKREPVEGRCVQRPVPGRSCAVGSRHQGHRASIAVSRAKCRNGTVRFTVQRP